MAVCTLRKARAVFNQTMRQTGTRTARPSRCPRSWPPAASVGRQAIRQRESAVQRHFRCLRHETAGADPDLLVGTPCCPGLVEGAVRVARTIDDAKGLRGEILIAERTDPGGVPLYPSCSGLLIERGSLLSHSAVVARELGLPTIVGISGGLMQKLHTGSLVRIDATKGEVRILS